MKYAFERHMAGMERRVATSTRNGEPTTVLISGRTYAATSLELWDALT
mgnify:FL=1